MGARDIKAEEEKRYSKAKGISVNRGKSGVTQSIEKNKGTNPV